MKSCELCVLKYGDMPDWTQLEVMPTVCLIALPALLDDTEMAEIVRGCIAAGTLFFATHGNLAREMEDQIDWILSGNEAWLGMPTTAHVNEAEKDLAHFLVHTAYCEQGHFRCLVMMDTHSNNTGILLGEIRDLCASIPHSAAVY